MRTEHQVRQAFVRRMRAHKFKVMLWPYYPGPYGARFVPDIVGLTNTGRFVAIELKAPGKKPRQGQLTLHQKIMAMGGKVFVVDSEDMIDKVEQWILDNTH